MDIGKYQRPVARNKAKMKIFAESFSYIDWKRHIWLWSKRLKNLVLLLAPECFKVHSCKRDLRKKERPIILWIRSSGNDKCRKWQVKRQGGSRRCKHPKERKTLTCGFWEAWSFAGKWRFNVSLYNAPHYAVELPSFVEAVKFTWHWKHSLPGVGKMT